MTSISRVVVRIFVYEYANNRPGELPRSIVAEGRAMFAAICADFSNVADVAVLTLPQTSADEESEFKHRAANADFTLVIAPEFDDILMTRCCWVIEAGGRLLGPAPDAIQRTADKWALGNLLRAHGIRTPECWKPGGESQPPPWVCKPRFGAGSFATFLVRDLEELSERSTDAPTEHWLAERIVQPFVRGQPASVSFLIGPQQAVALVPAAQELSSDGRFRYRGGYLPIAPSLAERAIRLGDSAIEVIPGLQGYVGVDVVLGDAANGSEDWIIEINPRLTTSYIGLRALARTNLADSMLRIVSGGSISTIEWHPRFVRFTAGGEIHYAPSS